MFFTDRKKGSEGKGTINAKRDIGVHPPRNVGLMTFQGSSDYQGTSKSSPSHQGTTDLDSS